MDVFSWLREHRALAEPVVTAYLFIVFYCYLEKYLTREDYRKRLDVPDRRLQISSR